MPDKETMAQPKSDHGSFVHLRLHTAYSLSEGAIHIAQLPGVCRKFGMPALAITDRNNLFGALEFSTKLAAEGIQPIVGCSLALDPGRESSGGIGSSEQDGGDRPAYPSIALLVKNETGYLNLLQLSSKAFEQSRGSRGPHVTLEELESHAAGLIALTGGREGPIDQALLDGAHGRSKHLLDTLRSIYPDNLYVELQRHGEERFEAVSNDLVELAYDFDLPLVATNEPYFVTGDLAEAHDVLLCISQGAYLTQQHRRRLTPEHYIKSPREMADLFEDLPEAIDHTIEISQRCSYMPEPRKPILPTYHSRTEKTESEELREQAETGLRGRLAEFELADSEDTYWRRLNFELDVITRMDFTSYFLIVADFIKWAKQQGIPVGPGRGSGAGSVVAWALTITDLDPLRFGLLFERFLNPDRVSMPDFDIDFCQERRDEVIHYVQKKYGSDRVAQIITFGKLQARAVVRDVGRVLEISYGQVDRISKLIPHNPANPVSLGQAIKGEPDLQHQIRTDETVKRLTETALKLEGLYRHASTHAAGVVIGDRPLHELVPIYFDPRSDMPVTQFNLEWVEHAGLVKFDFLGLKTLTVLERAKRLLAARGLEIDLNRLPLDDEKTYAMLARGDSIGVFQFESSGMRDLLRQAVPGNFEDLVALIALFRPGPMDNIPKYLACKHGREKPEFLHESVESIVADTYGVIIYQEQVMQIAQVLSGYSLAEADLLRRAMGKKKKDEMAKQKSRFIDGAVTRGVDRERADHIFELVAKFAGYGFNKSHSAGYALVAYQTAYIKANYPIEFFAASMTFDKGNTDKLSAFRQDAETQGIRILPPDINLSDADFTVVEGKIVYALSAIKNVGEQAMRNLVEVREEGDPFKDLTDFARRVDPRLLNKRAIENLAKAGAFDSLFPNRAQISAGCDALLSQAIHAAEERASSQSNLFGEDVHELTKLELPPVEEWTPHESLEQEMQAVGLYLSGHPLDDYRDILRSRNVVLFSELQARTDRKTGIANLAGTILKRRNRRSQRSDRQFAHILLSDPTGSFEVTFFSDTLLRTSAILDPGRSVVVTTAAEWEGDELRLTAKAVRSLDEVLAEAFAGFRVFINEPDSVELIRKTLQSISGKKNGRESSTSGHVNLVLLVDSGEHEIEIRLPGRIPMEPGLKGALMALGGVVDVQEL